MTLLLLFKTIINAFNNVGTAPEVQESGKDISFIKYTDLLQVPPLETTRD